MGEDNRRSFSLHFVMDLDTLMIDQRHEITPVDLSSIKVGDATVNRRVKK